MRKGKKFLTIPLGEGGEGYKRRGDRENTGEISQNRERAGEKTRRGLF
ncbi:MAG: hypothetical protein U5J96_12455 [Ignavibacteriaceae bacterium]|nr:hypothetical protein [Ignavibacteriaceae bacterium]